MLSVGSSLLELGLTSRQLGKVMVRVPVLLASGLSSAMIRILSSLIRSFRAVLSSTMTARQNDALRLSHSQPPKRAFCPR